MEFVTEFSTSATGSALAAWAVAGNFAALIVLTLIFLIFGMRGGRGGLVPLILALYIGYAFYSVFPFTDTVIAAGGTSLIKALLSAGLLAILSLVPFVFLRRIVGGGFGSLSFVPNLILAVLASAFVISLGYHVFDIESIYKLPETIATYFAPEGYFFWWFVAPLIGLFFVAR